MRFPRKNSINDHSVFVRVKKTGRAKAGRFVILSTLEDASLLGLRAAHITSRRAGKAHERNLLRRRFRSFIQKHAPQFLDAKRYLVTIARSDARDATYEDLEKDWLRQARRLGLFPKPEQPATNGS